MLKLNNINVKIDEKEILNDFNLEIKEKEIHVLMGPNGIGKSTICKVLLNDPNYDVKGDILFDGKLINKLNTTERARLGIYLVNQNPIEIEGVTNAEMLRTTLSEIKNEYIPIFEFNKKMESICQTLHLDKSFIHRGINEGMSGGERKKNELLHLYMLEPKLIILDELDSGLDVDSLKVVCESLKEYYKNHQCSILIITHHNNILKYLKPDYVHILENGKIIKSGTYELAKEIEKKGFKAFNIKGQEKNE